MGEQISYATAWNNTHGTPTVTDSQGNDIDDHLDPLFCDHYSTCTGTYAYPNDQAWTVQVVTQIQSWGKDSNASALAVSTTTYRYSLGYYGDVWTPSGDVNWLNYYDGEYRGMGTVYTISSSNDLTVDHYYTTAGVQTSPTMAGNYLSGELQDEEIYSGNSTTGPLLQETDNVYAGDDNSGYPASCILTGIGGYLACESVLLSHKVTTYNGTVGNGAPWIQETYGYDDFPLSGSFNAGTSKLYHNMIEKDISGSNLPSSIYPLKETWTYAPNDQDVNLTTYYDVNKVASSKITDASGHIWQCTYNLYDEGVASGVPTPAAGMLTKQQTYSSANCSGQTSPLTRDYTGYDAYGNVVATVDSVGTANKPSYASVGCTLATAPVSITGAWPNTRYTTCTSYDSLNAVPTTQKNALGQTTTTTYDQTQQDQPISVTNPNSQTATEIYSYDSNGNSIVQEKQPLENGSYTSQSSEASSCSATSTLPCYESDTLSSLYSNAVTRTFYDSQGRVVETRSPGATPGDDTVVMTVYNDQNHTVWKSVPFQVAHGSGWIDPNGATDINGNAPAGTITFYDALDRVVATQYPNYGSSQEPGLACSTVLSGTYTACTNYSWGEPVANSPQYELATSVDPNGHETQSFTDAQGNVVYANAYSGVYGGALTLVKQTQTQYNALNKPTSVTATDEQPQSGQSTTSVTTTMTYDDLGRLLTVTDPDQGTLTYSYDPDGHISSVVQTAGSNSRTLGYNYDLLGRMTCEQTAAPTFNTTGACSAGSPLVQNTYDTTKLGTQGSTDFPIGQLTQSVATTSYPDGSSATVTEQFQHDQRGRLITEQVQLGLPSGWGVTSALPAYQETMLYNDADQVTTTSTNASGSGYTFTQVYDATNGTLQGLSNNGGSTANLATLTYNEYAQLGSITQLNGAASSPASLASETFNYDANLRPLSLSASWLPGSGNNGLILSQGRTYDNASNVTSVDTTFAAVPGQTGSGGSETQNFCYDEQNRLIWSGNAGTQPSAGNGTCGSGTLNSGLSGASYTAPYTYTNLGQIWSGPLNGQGSAVQYLYCNSSAPHQLTGIYPAGTTCANKGNATATYSASYDPWGNLTSRTYNGVTATLSYDALNRLTEYNAGSSGQEFYLYDASGNRILKRSLSGGSTTLAIYLFGLEEYHYSGSGVLASQLHYYSLAGHLIGSTDGTTTTFYLTDALGSVLLSFSQNAILGEQIYGPYGASRYMAGNITTAKGYTGQFHDAVSGLDYYNARYYDPVVGRFLSVDSVQGNMLGFDPYAYVSGNPETMSDPTGHWSWWLTAAVAVVVVAAAVVTAPFWAPALLPTVAAGAVVAACSGTVATVAGGAIGGAIAGGGSAVVGDLINESHGTPLSLDQLGDDAGKGALLGELAGGIGQLAMPGIAAVSKFVASGISDTTLATSVANSTQGCLNTLYQTTLYGTTTWAGYAVTHPKQAFGAAVNEDKQTAKALHMSYDHYKKFQHANAVALDKQFTDEQQHYVQRWHSFLISMRSQSRGQAYTPRQEAMINQWRHAYYA